MKQKFLYLIYLFKNKHEHHIQNDRRNQPQKFRTKSFRKEKTKKSETKRFSFEKNTSPIGESVEQTFGTCDSFTLG